jgi:hypothetical protein
MVVLAVDRWGETAMLEVVNNGVVERRLGDE